MAEGHTRQWRRGWNGPRLAAASARAERTAVSRSRGAAGGDRTDLGDRGRRSCVVASCARWASCSGTARRRARESVLVLARPVQGGESWRPTRCGLRTSMSVPTSAMSPAADLRPVVGQVASRRPGRRHARVAGPVRRPAVDSGRRHRRRRRSGRRASSRRSGCAPARPWRHPHGGTGRRPRPATAPCWPRPRSTRSGRSATRPARWIVSLLVPDGRRAGGRVGRRRQSRCRSPSSGRAS